MTRLNEQALEAAIGCYSEGGCSGLDERERREVVADIVATYLSALPSVDVDELVERLKGTHDCNGCGEYAGSHINDLAGEAASHIQSQAARIAELEAGERK